METEEKDTGSVGSAGVPATDPAPDEAAEESEFEPDWDDPLPIDPECEHLTTASDFGLGQAFSKVREMDTDPKGVAVGAIVATSIRGG